MTMVRDIQAALQRKTGFEVVEAEETPTRLRLMGRVPLDKKKLAFWLDFINSALFSGGPGWACDVSKKYFEMNGETVYRWRLIFQGENLASRYESIVATIMGVQPARAKDVELTEFPLTGARPTRNESVRGKGATNLKG